MKILKVIHGYPPRYSAGSEVYSQLLAHELANKHEVQIFARQENSFLADYAYNTELDNTDARILINLVNIPRARISDKYIHQEVDDIFEEILLTFKPDIVHFGHLSHLSMNLPIIATRLDIPTIFTLHDFWLMCPRGQFLQRNAQTPWQICDGQDNYKCATQCYSGKFSGLVNNYATDSQYWTRWISERMTLARTAITACDMLIAPSVHLQTKFINEFDVDSEKIKFLDYGFNLDRLNGRARNNESVFSFGYIGTHTPQKGINLLIKAFGKITGEAKLKIWGYSKEDTPTLKILCQELPKHKQQQIEWLGGYNNADIVTEVFNKVDAIVVPSIWAENSPLVIHEAQQVRVPVITANVGGMSEYVHDYINGLLFEHRDEQDLANKMQVFVDDPTLAIHLGKKGYLYSVDNNVHNIKEHVEDVVNIYTEISQKKGKVLFNKPGPWRITFDTNPDHCNYKCIMCECFSPYSKVKNQRIQSGQSRRIMPIETIRKVLIEAQGSPLREIIPSTMGEPLLYKDFEEIIAMCHEFNLKMNLTTNGSFPIKGALEWSKLLVPILSDIKISWNGSTKEIHEKIMIGASWDKSLENLKILLNTRDEYASEGNRCTITLQLTFLEDNLSELVDIVTLAINLGVDRVKGHHLWAHFSEIKDLSMRRSQDSINRWNEIVLKLFDLVKNKLLPNGKQIILENFNILDEQLSEDIAPGGICPFLNKEAWIDTKGNFSPCCAPDELRKSLGNFGNIHLTSLENIWQDPTYKRLQQDYPKHRLCIGCNMRKPLIQQTS